MPLQLSPLEYAILERLRQLRSDLAQPPAQTVEVLSRELTPCGRHVALKGNGLKPGSTQIDMVGFPKGITADLTVAVTGTAVLEIVVNGGDAWDGQERAFHVV